MSQLRQHVTEELNLARLAGGSGFVPHPLWTGCHGSYFPSLSRSVCIHVSVVGNADQLLLRLGKWPLANLWGMATNLKMCESRKVADNSPAMLAPLKIVRS